MKQTKSMSESLASYVEQYKEAGYSESFIEGFAETFPKGFAEGEAKANEASLKKLIQSAKKIIGIAKENNFSFDSTVELVQALGFSTDQAKKLIAES